ncbi:MAG: Undecaprenyl-phosphate 4-deoxy-4-formamido-L-arabinose transferase [Phycisphaerae bacterium]|nr:Undecaprenyl-phosphate 4-deoxy-4-formamido-L-arabinose transferase [Phycisphaerae bacterium]
MNQAVDHSSATTPVQLSIIVPTYKEHDNLELLCRRIFDTMRSSGITAELILVDDHSQDGSVELVEKLQAQYPVRMIVRTNERGLSTAVLCGFDHANGDIFLVMDADLSHPPERIPDLYKLIAEDQADFVIGSRYLAGGQTKDWPFLRKLNSWGATLLARPLTSATDPMAGFFCLRRITWKNADPLNPLGYKIGLELMIKGRCQRVREVAIVFEDRHAGKSKLSARQQFLYLWHLHRLYRYRWPVLSIVLLYLFPIAILAALWWWLFQ